MSGMAKTAPQFSLIIPTNATQLAAITQRPLDELDPRERDDPSFIGDQPPDLSAIRAEEDSALGLALAKLPDTHRMIVRLRCWDKLEWDDIGRRVGRAGGAARKIWGRSIVRLRAELK